MLSLILSLLAVQSADAPQVDRLLADHGEMTRAIIPCKITGDPNEIVVCAARDADRWRVAYITRDPGEPDPDNVPAEKARLLTQNGNNCRNMTLSVAGCGMAGVSTTMGNGRGVRLERPRPLAP